MKLETLFKEKGIEKDGRDLHITRMYSSFVAVSEGRVIGASDSFLEYCPLGDFLYDMNKTLDPEGMKKA